MLILMITQQVLRQPFYLWYLWTISLKGCLSLERTEDSQLPSDKKELAKLNPNSEETFQGKTSEHSVKWLLETVPSASYNV